MPVITEAPMFLTLQEAADLLRVSTRTIRNRVKEGRLPAKRLTGATEFRFDRRDVLAQLEDVQPQGAEETTDEH